MRRVFGWLIVSACCVAVAWNVPGIVGDAAVPPAGACVLLAGMEGLS